jgi:hypothetical protein
MTEQSIETVEDQQHPTKRHGDALEEVVVTDGDDEQPADG